jgi:hypothetical protein
MATSGMNHNEREFYQHYYLMQNQRQGQHEIKSLTVSNFVLAGSLVGLGLMIGEEKLQPLHLFSILALIAVVNVLAWLYIKRSRYWVRVHQERATWALKLLSPELHAMQQRMDDRSPKDLMKAPRGGARYFHLTRPEYIQASFHLVIVVILLVTVLWDSFY